MGYYVKISSIKVEGVSDPMYIMRMYMCDEDGSQLEATITSFVMDELLEVKALWVGGKARICYTLFHSRSPDDTLNLSPEEIAEYQRECEAADKEFGNG